MNKVFVPVCLYSNGFFLVKENIKFFLHVFSDYDEILFVVVDLLYGHNLIIKERVTKYDDAVKTYQKRGNDIYSLLNNAIREYASSNVLNTKITIKRWNDIAEKDVYKNLKKTIIDVFQSNPLLLSYCNRFILHNLKLMTSNITANKKHLEKDYLFSEIAMSIYLTEFCDYTDEIWERPQDPSLPDPIDMLYNIEKDSLHKILSKTESSRRQLYLNDVINSYLKN